MPNKVLIYGGSFDPPHVGHMTLLADAMVCLEPNLTILVPAYRAPLKSRHMASFEDRRDMLDAAVRYSFIESRRRTIAISDLEKQEGRRVYSYEVVEKFARRLRGSELFFLAGSDVLDSLHKWKRLDRFARRCTLIIGIRSGGMVGVPEDYPGPMMFLPRPNGGTSSTDIRRKLVCKEDVSDAVVPEARRIISERGLYTLGKLFEKWKPTESTSAVA